MSTVWQRVGRAKVSNVGTEIYPSEHATGAFTRAPGEGRRDKFVAEDAEARAINCAQCGAHIEDHAAIATCWHCDSDNFLGRRLSGR